jgi:hypothetical protein
MIGDGSVSPKRSAPRSLKARRNIHVTSHDVVLLWACAACDFSFENGSRSGGR